jgi:hypothetical protein
VSHLDMYIVQYRYFGLVIVVAAGTNLNLKRIVSQDWGGLLFAFFDGLMS